MSSTLSQIAAVVAGLALFMANIIGFPADWTKSFAKDLTVSVSLAILAAVLLAAIRNFGA